MALKYTILVILSNDAMSGYDLWKKLAESSNHYWKASQQQIYRELSKLEVCNAISLTVVSQESRPDKKLYRITETGKEILIAWITEPSEPTAIREELLVKVLAGYLVSSEVVIRELKRHHQIHSQNLIACRDEEKKILENFSELSSYQKYRYLALRRGIRYETEWVNWCEEAIAMLS